MTQLKQPTLIEFEWAETIYGQQWEYCAGPICSAVEHMGGEGDNVLYSWSVIDDNLDPFGSQIVASGSVTGAGAMARARTLVEETVRAHLT